MGPTTSGTDLKNANCAKLAMICRTNYFLCTFMSFELLPSEISTQFDPTRRNPRTEPTHEPCPTADETFSWSVEQITACSCGPAAPRNALDTAPAVDMFGSPDAITLTNMSAFCTTTVMPFIYTKIFALLLWILAKRLLHLLKKLLLGNRQSLNWAGTRRNDVLPLFWMTWTPFRQ